MKHTNFDNEVETHSAPLSFMEKGLPVLLTLFIISLVGSIIWGNEGFVELLASFF